VELPPTLEEQLLGALLEAHVALSSVLRMYADVERIGIERETLERSRQETRLDRSVSYLVIPHCRRDPELSPAEERSR
jgi:hypothetical protein